MNVLLVCVLLQIKDLKTENDGLKVEMDKRGIEVQHLKEKVCVCECVVHMYMINCVSKYGYCCAFIIIHFL